MYFWHREFCDSFQEGINYSIYAQNVTLTYASINMRYK